MAAARISSRYTIVATCLAAEALTPGVICSSGHSTRVKATHLEGRPCQECGLGGVGGMIAALICSNLVAPCRSALPSIPVSI
jgi:hypothetical protein